MIDDGGFDFSVCITESNSLPPGPFIPWLLHAQALHYILPWAVQALALTVHMPGHVGSPPMFVVLTNECMDE